MKIAILGALDTPITKDSLGGTEIWTYNFAEKLVALGHKVTLFASEGSHFSGDLIESAKRSEIEVPGPFLKISKDKIIDCSVRQIKEVIKTQDQFDILHISNCNFYFYLPLLDQLQIPVVITVHSYNFEADQAKKIFDEYPAPLYVFNANSFKQTWPDPKRFRVIHTGINLDDFEFNAEPQEYFFWMGRIHKDKGIEDAIKFAQLSNEKLIIAGPIRNQEYFDDQVQPYLSDKIKYVGELNQTKKVEYYKNARAFLMTTKRDESFGLVAAESMACGTPVVSYDRGALSEVVEDEVTGFVVERDNVEELVKKSKLIDGINRLDCRNGVEKKFNIEVMTKNYLDLYKALLEEIWTSQK